VSLLGKEDVKGKLISFFKAQWSNYEISTELSKNDALVRIATFHIIMAKDCSQIYENLPLTEDDRKKT
jgi:hypothetical protein